MLFRQLFDGVSSTYTYLVADPRSRQAVLMVNLDAASFPKAGGPRFFELLDKAYCSST